jgi:hypothetical protein
MPNSGTYVDGVVTCPHCYTRVLPSAAGSCPACGKEARQADGKAPTRVRMAVGERTVLSRCCCQCCAPTDRRVTVRRSTRPGESPLLEFVTLVLAPLLFLITRSPSERRTIKVKMPQCPRCATGGELAPVHVDFERFEMTFLVNERFVHHDAAPASGGASS